MKPLLPFSEKKLAASLTDSQAHSVWSLSVHGRPSKEAARTTRVPHQLHQARAPGTRQKEQNGLEGLEYKLLTNGSLCLDSTACGTSQWWEAGPWGGGNSSEMTDPSPAQVMLALEGESPLQT